MSTPFEIFDTYKGPRDPIFYSVLEPKPLNIFQIGAVQNFEPSYRIHSGWADIIWSRHLKKYGGSFTVCDINEKALNCSREIFKDIPNCRFLNCRGEDWLDLDNKYDIYYLDGSDSPDEMFVQFFKIERKNCVIICDDINIKGVTLLPVIGAEAKLYPIENGMAIWNYRGKNGAEK